MNAIYQIKYNHNFLYVIVEEDPDTGTYNLYKIEEAKQSMFLGTINSLELGVLIQLRNCPSSEKYIYLYEKIYELL